MQLYSFSLDTVIFHQVFQKQALTCFLSSANNSHLVCIGYGWRLARKFLMNIDYKTNIFKQSKGDVD